MWAGLLAALLGAWSVLGDFPSPDPGCPPGYHPLTAELCINVTAPGTWVKAATSCLRTVQPVLAGTSSVDHKDRSTKPLATHHKLDNLQEIILKKLAELEVNQVWWFPDFTSFMQEEASSWQDKLAYPYNLPEGFDPGVSAGWCYNVQGKGKAKAGAACTKPRGHSKLPGVCLAARFQHLGLLDTDSCPGGFSTGPAARSYCLSALPHQEGGGLGWRAARQACQQLSGRATLLQGGYRGAVAHRAQLCRTAGHTLVPLAFTTYIRHQEYVVQPSCMISRYFLNNRLL